MHVFNKKSDETYTVKLREHNGQNCSLGLVYWLIWLSVQWKVVEDSLVCEGAWKERDGSTVTAVWKIHTGRKDEHITHKIGWTSEK